MPRLLLINPNTDAALTARLRQAIAPALPAGTSVTARTARFGAPVIASEATAAVAAHAALDAYAAARAEADTPTDGASFDAVLLACFGDAGQFALRELCPVPVLTLVEPALAATRGVPYSIVTGGARWPGMLRRLLSAIAPDTSLVSVETLGTDSVALAAAGATADAALLAAIERAAAQGAQRAIIGGAALHGLAARLQPRAALPLIDCVQAAAEQLAAVLGGTAGGRPAQGDGARANVAGVVTQGLTPSLAALLAAPSAALVAGGVGEPPAPSA